MKQVLPRIMLAAPSSGSGKTTITCGLLWALKTRGTSCTAWKCGPDYIDPMFHKYVLGVEGGNLDSFFLKEEEIRQLLVQETPQGNLAVMEGVMGYFDGLAGISTQASSYEVARITDTPVILVVDCKGTSLSIAAVIKGFLEYNADGSEGKKNNQIHGVILNRISLMMKERLTPIIEELGVPVVGWIPTSEEMKLESRHLGLVMPEEIGRLQEQIEAVGAQISKTVDIHKIIEIANSASPLERKTFGEVEEEKVKIPLAVARDKAFCFYYQENLRLLEELGGELIFFSPLEDEQIPDGVQGLILGGGYPELYAAELSANTKMRAAVGQAIQNGIPLLAECGGFLYLHEQLEDKDGLVYPMVGVVEGKAYRTGKLSRFGYITLEPRQEDDCLKTEMKGHEFHYWDSTNCGEDWVAKKPLSTRSWNCIHSSKNQIVGFPHLYYPSNREFVRNWLKACRKGIL